MARETVVRPDLGGPFPEHVAIIMDGNGRWARERGMLRVQGHVAGVQSVREVTTECARMGLASLTLYAFSKENWQRSRGEIQFLMRLLRIFLHRDRRTLMENDIRLVCIGRLEDLPPLQAAHETRSVRPAYAERERRPPAPKAPHRGSCCRLCQRSPRTARCTID